MIQELAGGRPLEVHAAPEDGPSPVVPDGSQLLIWTRGPEINGLHVVPARGGTPRAVSHGYYTGCWSPDGLSIAVATCTGAEKSCSSTPPAGARARSGSRGSIGRSSIWTGRACDRLLFVSNDRQGQYTIWTIAPDGSDQRKIQSSSREVPSVRWAPDGTSIYFFQRDNQTFSLHRLPIGPGAPAAATSSSVLLSGLETTDTSISPPTPAASFIARSISLQSARARHHDRRDKGVDDRDVAARAAARVARRWNRGLQRRPRVARNLFTMPLTGGMQSQLTFLNG